MAVLGSWFELQPATSGDGGADLPRPLQAMRARLGQRRAPRRFEPFVTTSYWTECLSGKTASQRVSDETGPPEAGAVLSAWSRWTLKEGPNERTCRCFGT